MPGNYSFTKDKPCPAPKDRRSHPRPIAEVKVAAENRVRKLKLVNLSFAFLYILLPLLAFSAVIFLNEILEGS